jgi:pimeloyl-ACP methyl ester carboxylesterase
MPSLNANGIRIAFDTSGDPKAVPLLLISGLGLQLTAWPDEFIEGLVELGFYVIRFDNRDCGLSTKFEHAGMPSLPLAWLKSKLRLPLRAPYSVQDMADDAVGVLSALGVARAPVVGVSMGGMIGQLLAAKFPARVLSLTSIMSSSGRRGLPGPTPAVRRAMMCRPKPAGDLDAMVEHALRLLQTIASPAYPTPEKQLRRRVARALRRNSNPAGATRQLLAIAACGDRSAQLRTIVAPTLVIHGAADPMLPLACGVATAEAIPGARLEVIQGMGHDLPSQLNERLLALIDTHAHGKMTADSTARLFVKQ